MTHQDKGHYRKKHPPEKSLPPSLVGEVRKSARENRISCARAFRVAGRTGAPPDQVGAAIDIEEISLEKCQLGLFGYGPGKNMLHPLEEVSPNLKRAVETSLVEGRLPCAAAWEIAKRLRLSRMFVARACETLKIRISKCQLGAFR